MAVTTITRYLTPSTIDEALALKREFGPSAQFVAGGTDVVLHSGGADTLIDLQKLELSDIRADGGLVKVGATTTLTAVLESPLVAPILHGVIPDMLVHVGSPLLRNVATLGGHLARGKLSDIVPVLIAADTRVSWLGDGERSATLAEYYGNGAYLTDHVLHTIDIPVWNATTSAGFTRFARAAFDLAIVNVATRVSLNEAIEATSACVVIGNAPGPFVLAPEAEEALVGRPFSLTTIDEASRFAARAPGISGDGRAAEDYRRHLAGVLTRRSLSKAAEHLGVAL